MKDEIKEILKGIEAVIKHDGTLEFDAKELKILLNYITNLQQIEKDNQKLNSELRKENEELKERFDLVCKISEERKNKWLSLNEENENLFNIIKDYKSRINEAIEYIKEDMYVEPKELYGLIDGEHLLNILQGDKDE